MPKIKLETKYADLPENQKVIIELALNTSLHNAMTAMREENLLTAADLKGLNDKIIEVLKETLRTKAPEGLGYMAGVDRSTILGFKADMIRDHAVSQDEIQKVLSQNNQDDKNLIAPALSSMAQLPSSPPSHLRQSWVENIREGDSFQRAESVFQYS